jgi:gamma-butyrobetaine dioxygenase
VIAHDVPFATGPSGAQVQAVKWVTDSDGDVTSVRLLDRALAPVDCELDRVEEFYAALRELLHLSYAGDGLIEFQLHAGDMLVFNNQRLMHGRTAFDPASSKRHIRSCHVDLDEF